jgi:carboxymethylenebutenolidase
MGQCVNLTAADGFVFPAYEARPTGVPKGAVVVLQEIFGVNSHIRAVADGYAAQGYLAVAPATFHRVKPDVELGYGPDDIAAGRSLKAAVEGLPVPGVMPDIAAAVAHAAQAGKVAVVGYCWGGLLAWRAACALPGISAAVPYYGGGMTEPLEAARKPLCPVLAHFGEQDHAIPLDGVLAFQAAQPGVQVQIYAAQHGFNCDHRGAYNAPAAALALERTLAFLAQHIG